MNLSPMQRSSLLALLMLTVCLALAGCGSGVEVKRLTAFNYLSTPRGAEIEVFVGQVNRPKIEIAYLQSEPLDAADNEAKAYQLDKLRSKARQLGANAIDNVRLVALEAHGMVLDPAVPFTAWKQGNYNLYALRGTAIRYLATDNAPTTSTLAASSM
ncbi:MAG: hypothetical protein V2A74_10925 [bacterium]